MAIPLRADFDASRLRAAARESKDAGQTRRLLTLAAIYDGATRTEVAEIDGVTLQIIRDWVLRLNARGPEGLIDRKAPGAKPRLTSSHRAALAAAVEDGPMPAVHGVVRRRIVDLCQWLWDQFQVSVSEPTLSRELRAMGGLAQGSVRRSRMEWQDEGRRGTRPSAPRDQQTASTYIFGAICPENGTVACLVLPWRNTEAINLP